MSKEIEYLQRIRAKCVELLAIEERILDRYQKCGCIVCVCEDDNRCNGCGAQHCGTHVVGEIPDPVYRPLASAAKAGLRATIESVDHIVSVSAWAEKWENGAAEHGRALMQTMDMFSRMLIAAWPEELL